jgi:predicted DNA-binding WGR domain protein
MLSTPTQRQPSQDLPPGLALRWENPNSCRYYTAMVQQNLFNEWEVFCSWGGIGSRRGNSKVFPAIDLGDAQEKLRQLANRRRQRHYLKICL